MLRCINVSNLQVDCVTCGRTYVTDYVYSFMENGRCVLSSFASIISNHYLCFSQGGGGCWFVSNITLKVTDELC